ncbi:2183_t:CDS:10 [Funneliformis geosporum]|uniref:17083_t:CDS:1 n=1 Tax=Funneliformis geosporum TaxID=1117311 RepID=A0A9W4SUF2_9GLOM|nr:2183_t:CDS:10 [Funneliformis geosporum]CAI2181869.1 17083_t:CDS:10 [Funneliformis geosporum]
MDKRPNDIQQTSIIRLGFPSISTSFGEFPIDIAAEIGCEVIKEFLNLHNETDFELILIDNDTKALNAFESKWKEIKNDLDDLKFQIKNGNLLQIKDELGIECRYIVAEITWRMKLNTNHLSKQILNTVGSKFPEEVKRLYPNPGIVGESYPVSIPKDSILHTDEGIEQVIFVVSPNMNPSRSNPVSFNEAKDLLKKTYNSMMNAFLELKNGREYYPVTIKKGNLQVNKPFSTSSSQSSLKRPLPKLGGGGWANVLFPYCQQPEIFPKSEVYCYDDESVIIYDKYPKAKKHLLVIPRKHIDNIEELKKKDLELIRKLKEKGQEMIKKMKQDNPKLDFRMGFHAIQSLKQLHMHVISQDFISPNLKNKKHWNSFTTEFFKDVEEIEKILEEQGFIKFDKAYYENLLKSSVNCHLCNMKSIKNIPNLKEHLKDHWNED